MGDALERLILVSSEPVCTSEPRLITEDDFQLLGERYRELDVLLRQKNGFYAFERALHVFPSNCNGSVVSIEKWNDEKTWKSEFDLNLSRITFFAEDLFGVQFGIQDCEIIKFDPEISEIVKFADCLNDWSANLLSNCDFETGYPIAEKWKATIGDVPFGQRLLPKIPFVLGGSYEISNLFAIDAIDGMRFRGEISGQIKQLPDGTKVVVNVVE